MTTEKRLLGVNPVASGGEEAAEGVSFDGTNDYLSRSSDLSSNTDSATFTFSCWLYTSITDYNALYIHNGNGMYGFFSNDYTELSLYGMDPVSGFAYWAQINNFELIDTWFHLLISIDMSSTSTRHVYINDELWSDVQWNAYNTSKTIDFTSSSWYVGAKNDGSKKMKGRMAHVFLDHTYRDLSTTSNRRLFIDSDGKPASGQADLTPILYLPMTDADTAGDNAGTGGDFTVNGVLATAERGPNQYNCSASEFDGSNDYLENSSLSMPSDSKLFTMSLWYNPLSVNGDIIDFTSADSPTNVMTLGPRIGTKLGSSIDVTVYNGVDLSTVFSCKVDLAANTEGNSRHITISCDVSDTNKRHAVVDGVVTTATWSNYNNINVGWSKATRCVIGDDFNGGSKKNQQMGEFYLNNSYTDLSTDNPFWDSDANRPKPVAQVIEDTGTTPLIALPLRGDDAGNNLGTGGDFNVNSGPFTGARGGSEFWARSVNTNNSNSNYLTRGAVSASDTNKITLVCSVYPDSTASDDLIFGWGGYDALYVNNTSGTLAFNFRGYSATALTNALNIDEWNTIMISVDCSASSANVFINGVEKTMSSEWFGSGFGWDLSSNNRIGRSWDGYIGQMYVDSSYIDFSQETNRHLFIDQLGYWKDVAKAIEAGDIDDPLIFLQFNDGNDLGSNSGTGGDFTVNGSVTAGADVNPT